MWYIMNVNSLTVLFISCHVSQANSLADEAKDLSVVLPSVPTFRDAAERNGFQCEEYNVTTSDGYILRLFRIPGDVRRPVLLMHGILGTADDFIFRENTSLALTLVRSGYEVWAGNNRGNRYSRHHISLDPDHDERFWDYTFHEMGTIDLPTMIDFVLAHTGQPKLSALGHSEGTTIFYVLGSTRPEYNSKIKVFASLAPIAHIQNTRGLFPSLLKMAPELNELAEAENYQEVLGFNSDAKSLMRWICGVPVVGYDLCYVGGISPFAGVDLVQIGPEFFPTIIDHFPAGTSRKNLLHWAQVARRKSFAQYDYGVEKNFEVYGFPTPPAYDLSGVNFDVGLYVGANDFVSTVADVEFLREQLPRVVDYEIIAYPLWNHIDHIFGKDMPIYLFPLLLKLFSNY